MQVYICREVDYEVALCWQKEFVEKRKRGEIEDSLFLLEHPPIYTMGSDQKWEHLLYPPDELKKQGFGIYRCNRGGDITYHGPGQLVAYPIIHLKEAKLTPIGYVRLLEQIVCDVLSFYKIKGQRKEGYPGVWIQNRKICAIGIGVSRGVTFHGLALNVRPDLTHFQNIIPCGLVQFGVTSIAEELGYSPEMSMVQQQLVAAFERNLQVTCHVCHYQPTIGGDEHDYDRGKKTGIIAR